MFMAKQFDAEDMTPTLYMLWWSRKEGVGNFQLAVVWSQKLEGY